VDVVTVGSPGDQVRRGVSEFPQEGGEAAVAGAVLLGGHVAAAAPVLVADAPVAHTEGRGGTVGGALLGESASGGLVAVLHPVAHFLGGAAAQIAGEVGLRT